MRKRLATLIAGGLLLAPAFAQSPPYSPTDRPPVQTQTHTGAPVPERAQEEGANPAVLSFVLLVLLAALAYVFNRVPQNPAASEALTGA